mmetsp:Transcript_5467/g.13249  ORF Transcript_5467/g.13249 Transcript_5467/m.13249 type:complete len:228 (-) Transcript_5467:134-817(-)
MASTVSWVRVSSHTMALKRGRPVALDHTSDVSRWLVIPTASTSPLANPALSRSLTDASMHCLTLRKISSGSCSHHPGLSLICSCSWLRLLSTRPSLSKMSTRELCVPWSIDAMKGGTNSSGLNADSYRLLRTILSPLCSRAVPRLKLDLSWRRTPKTSMLTPLLPCMLLCAPEAGKGGAESHAMPRPTPQGAPGTAPAGAKAHARAARARVRTSRPATRCVMLVMIV